MAEGGRNYNASETHFLYRLIIFRKFLLFGLLPICSEILTADYLIKVLGNQLKRAIFEFSKQFKSIVSKVKIFDFLTVRLICF